MTVPCRRYLCLACGATMLVVPGAMLPRRWYSASAIALALALYGLERRPPAQVRRRTSPFSKVGNRACTGWVTLGRWADAPRSRAWTALRSGPPRARRGSRDGRWPSARRRRSGAGRRRRWTPRWIVAGHLQRRCSTPVRSTVDPAAATVDAVADRQFHHSVIAFTGSVAMAASVVEEFNAGWIRRRWRNRPWMHSHPRTTLRQSPFFAAKSSGALCRRELGHGDLRAELRRYRTSASVRPALTSPGRSRSPRWRGGTSAHRRGGLSKRCTRDHARIADAGVG